MKNSNYLKNFLFCIFILFIFSTSGCVNYIWYSPDRDQTTAKADLYECRQRAIQNSYDYQGRYNQTQIDHDTFTCMVDNGYHWIPEEQAK